MRRGEEREPLPRFVPGRSRPLEKGFLDGQSLRKRLLNEREVELQVNVESQRLGKLDRSPEQLAGRSKVPAPQRPPAGRS